MAWLAYSSFRIFCLLSRMRHAKLPVYDCDEQKAEGPREAYSAAMAKCQPACGVPMPGRMDLAMPSSRGGVGYS